MNKILNLLNKEYVIDLFRQKVLPLYPSFKDILDLEIIKHKKNIWEKTYHVVFEFRTVFKTHDKGQVKLSIFCSAHSSEPRENAFEALKYLWKRDFQNPDLTIPRALFYDEYLRAFFYRGVEGKNLYQYIREKDYEQIEIIVPLAAKWFAKLHKLPAKNAPNFNPQNSLIHKVVPGLFYILKRIKEHYPKHYDFYRKAYEVFVQKEEEFLASAKERWFAHGDAHPENVILVRRSPSAREHKNNHIAIIDFTDLCLSDFARDLGTFTQQIEYMIRRKIGDPAYANKIKNLFLKNYCAYAKIELDDELNERINNYYNWTAMRTATFFFLREEFDKKRAEKLLNEIKKKMGL